MTFGHTNITENGAFVTAVKQDWEAIATKVVELVEAKVVAGQDPETNKF